MSRLKRYPAICVGLHVLSHACVVPNSLSASRGLKPGFLFTFFCPQSPDWLETSAGFESVTSLRVLLSLTPTQNETSLCHHRKKAAGPHRLWCIFTACVFRTESLTRAGVFGLQIFTFCRVRTQQAGDGDNFDYL